MIKLQGNTFVKLLFNDFSRRKELSLCHKLKFSNPYIFTTGRRRPLIFQTYSNRIHSLKYLRSTTMGCTDIRIRKFEFVTKTQFLFFRKCLSHRFYTDCSEAQLSKKILSAYKKSHKFLRQGRLWSVTKPYALKCHKGFYRSNLRMLFCSPLHVHFSTVKHLVLA